MWHKHTANTSYIILIHIVGLRTNSVIHHFHCTVLHWLGHELHGKHWVTLSFRNTKVLHRSFTPNLKSD